MGCRKDATPISSLPLTGVPSPAAAVVPAPSTSSSPSGATDVMPPHGVAITSPANNASISGIVQVQATALDDVGVAKMEFYVDTTLVGTDTSVPYQYSLNTLGFSTGAHTLRARAFDGAGNFSDSSTITIQVDNGSSGQGTIFHVRKDGSGNFTTIQACANAVQAGDTCVVHGGTEASRMTYAERVILASNRSGTSSAKITFLAEPSRSVEMQGFVVRSDYTRIEGFSIQSGSEGIWIDTGADGSEIVDNYIHDAVTAIQLSWTSPWPKNGYIAGNLIVRPSMGIVVFGENWLVENNEVFQLKNAGGDSDYSRVFGRNITFRSNFFHGADPTQIGRAHVDGIQIFDSNGWYADGIVVENNLFESFHQGMMLEGVTHNGTRNITVRNNIFIGGKLGGAWGICATTVQNVQVYHNIFAELMYYGVGAQQGTTMTARNNIFNNIGDASYLVNGGATLNAGNNLLFATSGQVSSPYSTDIRNRNPLFADISEYLKVASNYAGFDPLKLDFRLKAGSPGIDAGVDVGVAVDRVGVARPQGSAVDIGPFEYTGSQTPPPSPTETPSSLPSFLPSPSPSPTGGGTLTGSANWQGRAIPSQTGSFRLEFDAVPAANFIDGVTGLSLGMADEYSDLAAIVRFNVSGTIDAISGATYQSLVSLPYVAGYTYRFRMEVDIINHVYSAYVTPPGSATQTIGTNLVFRSQQAQVPSLSYVSLRAEVGSYTVSNIVVSALAAPSPTPSPSPSVRPSPLPSALPTILPSPSVGPLPTPSPTATFTGEQIYVAQGSAGSDTGANCANAHGASWLNNSANWGIGTGKISAGDTVRLCGIITTTLSVRGSGSPGAPITIYFEPDAKLSQPAGTLLIAQDRSYLVIDGGTNGILENTNNGTGRTYRQTVSGIYAPGVSNFEVKNLTIQNLYVHTSVSDSAVDFPSDGGIYLNGFGSNISIHDSVFHDICWIINSGGGSAAHASGFQLYNNHFYNYDHAYAGPGGNMANPANVNIYNNHFGSTANWDTTANAYHHDGIHTFFDAGGYLSGMNIYNNLFDGDWGVNNTAHIFLEGDYTRANPDAITNVNIYNNVFVVQSGRRMNNGAFGLWIKNLGVYNNTIVGGKATGDSDICTGGGNLNAGLKFKNNIVTSCDQLMGGVAGTGTDAVLDHNLYADGGGNAFVWEGSGSSTYTWDFSLWASLVKADTHSQYATNAGVTTTGILQTGSPAIGRGENLTGLGLPGLNKDRNGNPRPASGAWDIGAYVFR